MSGSDSGQRGLLNSRFGRRQVSALHGGTAPMTVSRRAAALALLVMGLLSIAWPRTLLAARDLTPESDTTVIEQLPPRVPLRGVSTPQEAAETARRWIEEARQLSEPRYLGRAQAALAPWWDRADAPAELAVLQATIEQSRHEFAAARATLERALARSPLNAQGWLTLATLGRVAARYADALAGCDKVKDSGAPLYAQACRLEIRSLLGHHDEARDGLQALLRQRNGLSVRAWLLSHAGENEDRAGRFMAAAGNYRASLLLAEDDYTALALADLLLRESDLRGALAALADRPASDAVQLRRAAALKRQGDAGWQALAADLRQRFAALAERGDDPALHAREAALYALWIEDDAGGALRAAQLNLQLQKEPFDWWLALTSAESAGQPQTVAQLAQALHATGLIDARLAPWRQRSTPP